MISLSSMVVAVILGVTLGALIVLIIVNNDLKDYKRLNERIAERIKVELTHSGGGCLYLPPNWDKEKDGDNFNYLLKSWDGGKIWYAVEIDKDCVDGLWGLKILGRADELYPGLIEHIEGWNKLLEYVQKHGPINFDDSAGIRRLEDMGFTVTNDTSKTE